MDRPTAKITATVIIKIRVYKFRRFIGKAPKKIVVFWSIILQNIL